MQAGERLMRDTVKEANKDTEHRYHLCEQAIMKAVKSRENAELYMYRENVDKAVSLVRQLFAD